jgi:hypothetical protein
MGQHASLTSSAAAAPLPAGAYELDHSYLPCCFPEIPANRHSRAVRCGEAVARCRLGASRPWSTSGGIRRDPACQHGCQHGASLLFLGDVGNASGGVFEGDFEVGVGGDFRLGLGVALGKDAGTRGHVRADSQQGAGGGAVLFCGDERGEDSERSNLPAFSPLFYPVQPVQSMPSQPRALSLTSGACMQIHGRGPAHSPALHTTGVTNESARRSPASANRVSGAATTAFGARCGAVWRPPAALPVAVAGSFPTCTGAMAPGARLESVMAWPAALEGQDGPGESGEGVTGRALGCPSLQDGEGPSWHSAF